MPSMKVLTVRLPDRVHRQLAEHKADTGVVINAFVVAAIINHIGLWCISDPKPKSKGKK